MFINITRGNVQLQFIFIIFSNDFLWQTKLVKCQGKIMF